MRTLTHAVEWSTGRGATSGLVQRLYATPGAATVCHTRCDALWSSCEGALLCGCGRVERVGDIVALPVRDCCLSCSTPCGMLPQVGSVHAA